MNVWTKRGADIFSPTDAAGLLRSVLNGEVQVWSTEVERAVYYAMVSGNLAYATKADLDADLAHDDGTVAWVVADTEALNGIYVKSGASGSGSWAKERNLPTGPQGDIGGVAYRFDDGTADADPGTGLIRANDADLSAATELYVSKSNRYGDDLSGFLATLAGSTSSHKGYLVLTAPDSETQAAFNVTGVTDAVGYVTLVVTGQGGATSFINAERLIFLFSRTGNAGDLNGVNPGNAGLDVLESESPEDARTAIDVYSKSEVDALSPLISVATRAALKALDTSKYAFTTLTEAKRGGPAVFDNSNLSSEVSADTTEAHYVAPNSDPTGASGAWRIRNFPFMNSVQDFLTPQMFGAVGDDVTDDLAAYNAMFAAIAASGSKVFIPPAAYHLSDNLLIQDKVLTVEGVKTGVSTFGSRLNFAADKGLIIANNDGSVFRGIRFSGDPASVSGQVVGVGQFAAASGSSYVRFDDCDFNGGYRNIWLQKSLATRFTSCRFTEAVGLAAVAICDGPDATHGVDAAEFLQCTVSGAGANTDCVRMNGKAHSVKMTQCAILFGNVGIRMMNSTGGSNPKFFYFSDGGFENGDSHAVYVEEGDDLKFSNSYISNDAASGDGIHMAASMDGHLSVHNTTIRGCGRDGVRVLGGRAMVVGNRVMNNGSGTTGDGVRLAAAVTRFVISDNFIGAAPDGVNNQRYGIFNDAGGSAGKISDNFIIDNVTGDFGGATGGTGAGITNNL